MKGFKNGGSKSVTKSGRNIKSQLGFTSHYFKTSSQSDVSNLAVGPVTANNTITEAGVSAGSSTPWPYLKTVDDPWSIDSRVGNPKAAWSYDFSSYQLAKNIPVSYTHLTLPTTNSV